MFVSTYSYQDDYTHETPKVIGVFNSEIGAIKATLSFLLENDRIWCGLFDSLADIYGDDDIEDEDSKTPVGKDIYSWYNSEETQALLEDDGNSDKVLFSQFVDIVTKHVTTIAQFKTYVKEHDDTYLGQTWNFTITPVTLKD